MDDPADSYDRVVDHLRTRTPEIASALVPHLRPALRFLPAGDGAVVMRLGGGARLPADVAWPTRPSQGDRPLHHVATVDLAAVAALDPTGLLPRAGVLQFFYDAIDEPWGYEPHHADGWFVRYDRESADDTLRLRDRHPSDEPPYLDATLPEVSLRRARVTWTLPDLDERAVGLDGVSDLPGALDPGGLYDSLDALKTDELERWPKMLGWPTVMQYPMADQCVEMAARAHAVDSVEGDWQLLLQLYSWEDGQNSTAIWGSWGFLYVWILRDDLRAARFDRVWVILQCT